MYIVDTVYPCTNLSLALNELFESFVDYFFFLVFTQNPNQKKTFKLPLKMFKQFF